MRDVPRSVAFFEQTLGWRPIARPGNIGTRAAWLEIGPGLELHLIEDPAFEPSPFEREFGRHIAVARPLAEFPQLKERLQAYGAELIEPIRATPFARFFSAIRMAMCLRSSKRAMTSPGRSSHQRLDFRSATADPE